LLPAKNHGRKRVKHPGGVDWSGRKLYQIANKDVRALHACIAATAPVLATGHVSPPKERWRKLLERAEL